MRPSMPLEFVRTSEPLSAEEPIAYEWTFAGMPSQMCPQVRCFSVHFITAGNMTNVLFLLGLAVASLSVATVWTSARNSPHFATRARLTAGSRRSICGWRSGERCLKLVLNGNVGRSGDQLPFGRVVRVLLNLLSDELRSVCDLNGLHRTHWAHLLTTGVGYKIARRCDTQALQSCGRGLNYLLLTTSLQLYCLKASHTLDLNHILCCS